MDIPNQLLPTRIMRTEAALTSYTLEVEPGITPAQVVDPDFWQHLCAPQGVRQSNKLRVNDKIEVIAKDGSFDMELRVIAIDPRGLWAQVRALRLIGEQGVAIPGVVPGAVKTDLDIADPDGYRIEFAGPHKFRIVRGNDVLEMHIPTKAAAYAKLAEIKAEKVAA